MTTLKTGNKAVDRGSWIVDREKHNHRITNHESRITKRCGLTLIELMVAVAVLCLGVTLIQEGLLRSLTLLGRYEHSLTASAWMREQLWQAREAAFFSAEPSVGSQSGAFNEKGKDYNWELDAQQMSTGGGQFYSFKLDVVWTESGREVRNTKECHLNRPKLS